MEAKVIDVAQEGGSEAKTIAYATIRVNDVNVEFSLFKDSLNLWSVQSVAIAALNIKQL